MAVKLSSYLWMRNNELMPIVEDPYRQPYMSPKKKAALKKIIDEIDELHEGSEVSYNTTGLVGPGVVLSGFTEIIEKTSDPDRTRDLYHQIHDTLKEEHVSVEIYRDLGRAFNELGITTIDPDLQIAIDYGTRHFDMRSRSHYGPDVRGHMRADYVIEAEKRGKSSPERF